jgi:hypothetical protein
VTRPGMSECVVNWYSAPSVRVTPDNPGEMRTRFPNEAAPLGGKPGPGPLGLEPGTPEKLKHLEPETSLVHNNVGWTSLVHNSVGLMFVSARTNKRHHHYCVSTRV